MKTINFVAFIVCLLAFGINLSLGNLGFAALDAVFALTNFAVYRLA